MNELTITPGFYRHWKGQIYYVSDVHVRRDTAPFVVYCACHGDNPLYTRPASEWFDVMGQKENGEPLYRFEKIKYDVAEVRHGEWVPVDEEIPCDEWDCTACGERRTFVYPMDFDEMKELYQYCPNCGAKMDGGKENGK